MLPRPTTHSAALGPGVTGPSFLMSDADFEAAQRMAPHRPGAPIQPCGDGLPFCVEPSALGREHAENGGEPVKHTQSPIVTGTSVLALTYRDGVMIACDTLGSYGSTKRYKSVDRLRKVNERCVIGAGGEFSDFQHIHKMLDELATQDFCEEDDATTHMTPKQIYAYLTRVMYNRRNKFDPLWNSLVIAGVEPGENGAVKPFVATIGMIGTHYSDAHIATGFGNHLARPLFREAHRPDMSEEEATALLKKALRVCYYRDKQSINKFTIGKVTAKGVEISEPFSVETKWDFAHYQNPSRFAPGTW